MNRRARSKVGRRLRVAIIRWRSIKSRGAAVGQRNVAEVREREPSNVLSRVKPWLKCSPRGEDLLSPQAGTRALRYTCACLRANFLCRSLTRFEFDGEAWSKYFSRRRDTQSGFVRRLNSTLTSNPSLKYSLHGSFVFCSEIYLSLSSVHYSF